MSSHRFDPISLVGGVVGLGLGIVGLLRSADWIDDGAVFWAIVVIAAGLGFVGAVCSLRGLVPTQQQPSATLSPGAPGPAVAPDSAVVPDLRPTPAGPPAERLPDDESDESDAAGDEEPEVAGLVQAEDP